MSRTNKAEGQMPEWFREILTGLSNRQKNDLVLWIQTKGPGGEEERIMDIYCTVRCDERSPDYDITRAGCWPIQPEPPARPTGQDWIGKDVRQTEAEPSSRYSQGYVDQVTEEGWRDIHVLWKDGVGQWEHEENLEVIPDRQDEADAAAPAQLENSDTGEQE